MKSVGLAIEYRELNRADRAETEFCLRRHQEYPAEEWGSERGVSEEWTAHAIEKIRKDAELAPSERTHCFLLALAGSVIVGLHWLKYDSVYRMASISSLWVHPGYRGRGIAHELKDRGESWARARGATVMDTRVNLANVRMIELNEKLGYRRVSVEMKKKL